MDTLNMSATEVWYYGPVNYPTVRLLVSSDDRRSYIFSFASRSLLAQLDYNATKCTAIIIEKLSGSISSGRINDILHEILVSLGVNLDKVNQPTIVLVTPLSSTITLPSASPSLDSNINSVSAAQSGQSEDKTVLISAVTVGLFFLLCVGTWGAYYWRSKLLPKKSKVLDPVFGLPKDLEEPNVEMDRYNSSEYFDIQLTNPASCLKIKNQGTEEAVEVENLYPEGSIHSFSSAY